MIHHVFILGLCSQPSNPQNRAGKYTEDRSKLFATLLFVAIANVAALHTKLFSFSPHHGRFFRPLSPIVISVTTVRRHDVALPSISATMLTTQRPHELTMLSSMLSTPDIGMDKRPLQSRSGYKRKPFTQSRRCESSISIRARNYYCSCSSSS
jgi:hypothetical protein